MMRGPMPRIVTKQRFAVEIYRELKGDANVYVLTVAKGGPKSRRLGVNRLKIPTIPTLRQSLLPRRTAWAETSGG